MFNYLKGYTKCDKAAKDESFILIRGEKMKDEFGCYA